VPVRQWVLSFPMPLRMLFAAQPQRLAPLLQVIHRVIASPGSIMWAWMQIM
jgi:hypothetical protein